MKLIELLLEYTSYEDMIGRLQSAYILIARGDTKGEKSAASAAYDRLLAAIRRDYGDNQANAAEATVKGKGQSGDTSGSSRYRRRPDPEPKPKQNKRKASSSGSSDRGYGGEQSHVYTDPRTGWIFYVLRFIDPAAGKRGSDKVWGYATRNGQFVSFWGAYGKAVRTKALTSDREALKLFDAKVGKGYKRTNAANNLAAYSYIFSQFQ